MVVLFEKNVNGKIEFTKEELETLLEQARQEGIKEGQKYSYIYTTPSSPLPNNPIPMWQSPFTCGTLDQTNGGTITGEIKLNGVPTSNGI